MAISGSPWLTEGWSAVAWLVALGFAKLLASSITIGSGGSAGDFAPSLAIGGLLGGAFGRAAQLLFHDPRLSYGAFALVGMGTFYGGIAHTPFSALVLVCELAGNYDLLVQSALRRRALYTSQVPTQRDSPLHRDALLLDLLRGMRVSELMGPALPVCFRKQTPSGEVLLQVGENPDQEVFPVLDDDERVAGLISANLLRVVSLEHADTHWTLAADLMQPVVFVLATDDLRTATERMISSALRELPVLDAAGRVLGLLDESEIAEVYLKAAFRAESADRHSSPSPAPGASARTIAGDQLLPGGAEHHLFIQQDERGPAPGLVCSRKQELHELRGDGHQGGAQGAAFDTTDVQRVALGTGTVAGR